MGGVGNTAVEEGWCGGLSPEGSHCGENHAAAGSLNPEPLLSLRHSTQIRAGEKEVLWESVGALKAFDILMKTY